MNIFNDYQVQQIDYSDTKPFFLHIHYAKRMPSVSFAYGLFKSSELVGVISYGMPASPRVCDGICGKEYAKDVLELNRLVLKYNRKNEGSRLIAESLKLLPKPKIVISYADTSQDHIGYVYQATNWIYFGLSAVRTDRVFVDGSKQIHGRHVISTDVENIKERTVLVQRPRKHRYLMIMADKRWKKQAMSAFKYGIEPYPKGIPSKKSVITDLPNVATGICQQLGQLDLFGVVKSPSVV